MPEIDHVLYQETKENLISAANGDPDVEEIVEFQLQDMKECGFFDLPKDDRYDDQDDEEDWDY